MGNDEEFSAVVDAFRGGALAPPVDSVFALEDGRAAFERLAGAEQFGKIVIAVDRDSGLGTRDS
jgi:NADPH:quinone reductase-like Zn-dependent oxidoreductase